MNQGDYQNTLQEIRRLLGLLCHDLAKPEATVRMFVDVLDEIKDHPEDLAKWKEALMTGFRAPTSRLRELEQCFDTLAGKLGT